MEIGYIYNIGDDGHNVVMKVYHDGVFYPVQEERVTIRVYVEDCNDTSTYCHVVQRFINFTPNTLLCEIEKWLCDYGISDTDQFVWIFDGTCVATGLSLKSVMSVFKYIRSSEHILTGPECDGRRNNEDKK